MVFLPFSHMKHTISSLILLLSINGLNAQPLPTSKAEMSNEALLDQIRVKYQNPSLKTDVGVGLWAWPLPIDYDQDGDLDLLVSCPDVPFNGTYFFENPDGSAFPTFKAPVRIGKGFKNIQISYPNNQPRILFENKEFKDFLRTKFDQEVALFDADSLEKTLQKIRFKQWKWVDYENDGDLDLVVGMDDWSDYGWDNAFDAQGKWKNGAMHGFVYLIENNKGVFKLKGKIEADGKPIDVYGAPSPNFEDFDGDGDLDLICGEFMDKMTWFENIGTRTNPQYAKGRFLENEQGFIAMDLQMIIPTAIDWDKDGDIDLIVGDEDGRVAFIENTGKVKNRMPVFKSPRYFQQQADNLKFGALVTPVSVDFDDDGDEDLVCGNTAGYIGLIENLGGLNSPQFAKPVYLKANGKTLRIQAGPSGSIQGPCEAKWGYTTLSVADWNGDGLKDLIINSIWGKVRWYPNIGTKKAPAFGAEQLVKVQWEGTIPKPKWNWWSPAANELATQWRTTPYAIDWNKDGLMDLVMLDHEGYLCFFERFKKGKEWLLKPGKRIFYSNNTSGYNNKNVAMDTQSGLLRLNISENGSSGRRKFCFVDWDGDGDLDLLVNSISVHLLENTGTTDGRTYFSDKGALSNAKLSGHTTSPTVVDWDKNGQPDLLIGAEDGHFYLVPNGKK